MHMLGKIIRIVEMNDSLFMSLDHFLGQQKTVGNILAHRSCHVVSLNTVDHRIFIGILLKHFLVAALNQA